MGVAGVVILYVTKTVEGVNELLAPKPSHGEKGRLRCTSGIHDHFPTYRGAQQSGMDALPSIAP